MLQGCHDTMCALWVAGDVFYLSPPLLPSDPVGLSTRLRGWVSRSCFGMSFSSGEESLLSLTPLALVLHFLAAPLTPVTFSVAYFRFYGVAGCEVGSRVGSLPQWGYLDCAGAPSKSHTWTHAGPLYFDKCTSGPLTGGLGEDTLPNRPHLTSSFLSKMMNFLSLLTIPDPCSDGMVLLI